MQNYRWIVTKRILPHIGRIKLKDLRPDRIQSFYDFLLNQEERTANQIERIHKTLRASMNHAVNLGYLLRNPVIGTTPPKPKKKEMGFYDENQVQILLDTAIERNDRYHPLYYLAIHTGMRQAELMGLKWSDINWKANTISVARQAKYFTGESYSFIPPKSKAGKRTIILGQKAIDILKAHKEIVERLRESSGDNWTELDLIFPSRVGTPVTGSNIRRSFIKLIEASDLPKIRFHDLRHTAASLMLNHGIPVLIASRRLGHSKPSTTMDVYGHMMPSKQEEAAQLLDQLMNAI